MCQLYNSRNGAASVTLAVPGAPAVRRLDVRRSALLRPGAVLPRHRVLLLPERGLPRAQLSRGRLATLEPDLRRRRAVPDDGRRGAGAGPRDLRARRPALRTATPPAARDVRRVVPRGRARRGSLGNLGRGARLRPLGLLPLDRQPDAAEPRRGLGPVADRRRAAAVVVAPPAKRRLRRARGGATGFHPGRRDRAADGARDARAAALASRPPQARSGDRRGGPRAAAGDAGAPGCPEPRRRHVARRGLRARGRLLLLAAEGAAARRRAAAGVRRRPHVLRARLLGPAVLPGRLSVPAEPLLRAGAPVAGAARSALVRDLEAPGARGARRAAGARRSRPARLAARAARTPLPRPGEAAVPHEPRARAARRARPRPCAPRHSAPRVARARHGLAARRPGAGRPRAARAARPADRRARPRDPAPARGRRGRDHVACEPRGRRRAPARSGARGPARGRSHRSPACSSRSTC